MVIAAPAELGSESARRFAVDPLEHLVEIALVLEPGQGRNFSERQRVIRKQRLCPLNAHAVNIGCDALPRFLLEDAGELGNGIVHMVGNLV